MDFDSYLQNNGFKKGDYLSPETARGMYSSYNASMSTPAWSMVANAPKQTETSQSNSGGGLGGALGNTAGGMAQNYASTGSLKAGWGGVPGGAANGFMAGQYIYETDPRMKSKKDGFGTKYGDYRAQVGGAVLGGVMGYYGLGSLAGPATIAAHQVMEPTTRAAIKWGDSWGGSGGALMVDPIGTVASGKYSGGQLLKGALLGPFTKVFK
jgi:hypothetical protein